jgi:hypothetical protein
VVLYRRRWRLCRIAGPGGWLRARGDLAMVCSRSAGSRRPPVRGKSPEVLAFAVPRWARGNDYSWPLPSFGVTAGLLLAAGVVVLRRRPAAPDSSPSFLSSSGLQPSLVART